MPKSLLDFNDDDVYRYTFVDWLVVAVFAALAVSAAYSFYELFLY